MSDQGPTVVQQEPVAFRTSERDQDPRRLEHTPAIRLSLGRIGENGRGRRATGVPFL